MPTGSNQTLRVQLIIGGDPSGAVNAMGQVQKASSSFTNIFRSIGQQMLGFAGGLAIFEAGKRIIGGMATAGIGMNSILEQATIQFKVLTGSVSQANKAIKYLYEYAAKTPFRFPEVLGAASIVQGAKLEMEKWIPIIGDMASAGKAAGLTMEQIARAIARVRSGQVGEFFEFVGSYLGITRKELVRYGIAWQASGELADRSGAGIQKVMEAIYKEAGKRFKGMADEQSKTFAGMWSTITDTFGMIQAEVFKPFFERMRTEILPSLREMSDRFLDAYRAGGMLAGLKTVLPRSVVSIVKDLAEAWGNLGKVIRGLGASLAPLVDLFKVLAAIGFKGMAVAARELTQALTVLFDKLLSIPGMALVVQGLVGSFLLFRGIIPIIKSFYGLLGIKTVFTVLKESVAVFAAGWAMAGTRSAGVVGKLLTAFRILGRWLIGSFIGIWPVIAAAIIAAAVLAVRNWQVTGKFFGELWKYIKSVGIMYWKMLLVGFQEINYKLVHDFNQTIVAIANAFARLVEIITPLVGKIFPESWTANLERVSKAARNLATARQDIIKTAGAGLDAAKGQMWAAVSETDAAWNAMKEAGGAVGSAFVDDVKDMAKSISDSFKEVGQAAKDTTPAVEEPFKTPEEAPDSPAASAAEKLKDALEKLQATAGTAADAVIGLFQGVSGELGSFGGTRRLASEIRLAMVDIEEYIKAGGIQSGQALMAGLQRSLDILPGSLQEIGPRTTAFLDQLASSASMLMTFPLEEAKKKGIELTEAINQAWQDLSGKARDYARGVVEHLKRIGAVSAEQQADYYRKMLADYQWTADERRQIEEELYQANLETLEKEVQAFKDAYDERVKVIEDGVKAEVEKLEDALKALDEKDELADREKARSDHEKKIADLTDKRRYHELRTGREHDKALIEVAKDLAEEEQRWKDTQADWSLDKEKSRIKDEIDMVKQRGDERKAALKKEFDDTLKMYDGQFKELTARAAIWEPELIDKYRSIGRKSIEALATGQMDGLPLLNETRQAILSASPTPVSIPSALGEARQAIEKAIPETEKKIAEQIPQMPAQPLVSRRIIIPASDYQLIGDTAIIRARQLGDLLGLSVGWDAVNKMVSLGGTWFDPREYPGKLEEGTAWLPLRTTASRLGWSVFWNSTDRSVTLQKAHTGAKVKTPGIAELAPGELIFPSGLSGRLERLIAVLEGWGGRVATGTQVVLNGPLMNIQNASFEDAVDREALMRELWRTAQALGR